MEQHMEINNMLEQTKTIYLEYVEKYSKYMESLNETISDVGRDMKDISCPYWIRTQFINSYDMLLQKKRDYEDMHKDIMGNPEKFESVMKRFIQNLEN
jgi:hypothetical protein